MHASDRVDPPGGLVKRLSVSPLGTPEEDQVSHGLQAVLDPVVSFGEQQTLELGSVVQLSAGGRGAAGKVGEDQREQRGGEEQHATQRDLAGGQTVWSCRTDGRERDQGGTEPSDTAPPGVNGGQEREDEEQQQVEICPGAGQQDEDRCEREQPGGPDREHPLTATLRRPPVSGDGHDDPVGDRRYGGGSQQRRLVSGRQAKREPGEDGTN